MNQRENFAKKFTSDFESGYIYGTHIENDLMYIWLFIDFVRWKTNLILHDTIAFMLM